MTIVLDALSNRMHIQLRDKVDVCVDEIGKSLLKFRIFTDRSEIQRIDQREIVARRV
jgi:hypothetical protein